MREQMAAIALMPDNADDWMVENGVDLAYRSAMKLAAEDGATIVGPLTMKLVRHEPVYDEDGNLAGYHDAVRLAIDCERGEQ